MKSNIEKIRVVIIEDELINIDSLKLVIESYFSMLKIQGTATSVKEAITLIDTVKPDLIFLDIKLFGGDGFDVIKNTKYKKYDTIITTGYNNHAKEAFEAEVLHYLMKPITKAKLELALKRYFNKKASATKQIQKEISINREKITISTNDGIQIINKSDITRCEAEGNYTKIHLVNGNSILVSKNLQNFSDKLNHNFVRVHNSHIININYIIKCFKGKQCKLIMKEKLEIPISEKYRNDVFKKLDEIADNI